MKTDTQIKYLVFSSLLLVVSVSIFFILLSSVNKNKEISNKIELDWQNESTLRYELNSLNRLLKLVEKDVKMLGPHFVKGDDIVPFLDTLERTANLAGANAEVLSVGTLEDKSGLMIDIKATGKFESLYKYITLLENSRYELRFFSVSLVRQDGSFSLTPEWMVILKVKLLSYIK